MLLVCSMSLFAMDDQDDFWKGLDLRITQGGIELLNQTEETDTTQEVNILEEEDDYPQKVVDFLRKLVEGPVTNLHGIVAKNNSGQLECKVTCNSDNKKYSGILENNGYNSDTWQSRQLSEQKAEQYYVQLLDYLK